MNNPQPSGNMVDELRSIPHFKVFVYGRSGSGKTMFIKHLLANILGTADYTDIYVLCATYWDDYTDLAKLYRVTNQYNIFEITTWLQTNTGKKKILVLDDILTMALNSGKRRTEMEGIFADMRHYNCSAIISTQKVKGVPDTIRMLYSHVVATRCDKYLLEMIEGDLPNELQILRKTDQMIALYVKDFQYLYFNPKKGTHYRFVLDI